MLLVIFKNLLELNPGKKSATIVWDSTLIKDTGLSPAAWAGPSLELINCTWR